MTTEQGKAAADSYEAIEAEMRYLVDRPAPQVAQATLVLWADRLAALRAPASVGPQRAPADCICHRCIREKGLKGALGFPLSSTQMIVCPTCGNKRCPKASDHDLACTNSNEPGQQGSIFAGIPPDYTASSAPVDAGSAGPVASGRRVVCSAIRYGRMVICGVRHFDPLMGHIAEAVDPAKLFKWEQGFVDNRSVYMSRKEAFVVADAVGQIVVKHGKPDELYSEDFIPGYIPADSIPASAADAAGPVGREGEALLPCPFCGGAAEREERLNGLWIVGCLTANCRGFVRSAEAQSVDPRHADAAWNRRTTASTESKGTEATERVTAGAVAPLTAADVKEWLEEPDGRCCYPSCNPPTPGSANARFLEKWKAIASGAHVVSAAGVVAASAEGEALLEIANSLRYYLNSDLKYRQTGREPKINGYTYIELSEWRAKQLIEIADAARAAALGGKS